VLSGTTKMSRIRQLCKWYLRQITDFLRALKKWPP
jgi:hypothetical protein